MERPVLQPTFRWVGLQFGEMRVSAVLVDADRKQVDQTVSTIPDYVVVDVVDVSRRDSQAQSRSGLSPRGGGGVDVVVDLVFVQLGSRRLRSGVVLTDTQTLLGRLPLVWRPRPFLLVLSPSGWLHRPLAGWRPRPTLLVVSP